MLIERIESIPNGKWKMTIKSNFAQNSRKLLKFVYIGCLENESSNRFDQNIFFLIIVSTGTLDENNCVLFQKKKKNI